ncbi:hypothetical protein DFH08DRAFT_796823 [Mycena albidolilacea]|uniref:Uncharacterized protein n=1 Tax=Mycena albidolilacea TaxID=1033008 RepID=A0AAD7AVZ6_9AGAR|nr:hypothetical protein DFH08DRAFT_796823 [Mycena albidolilacea]
MSCLVDCGGSQVRKAERRQTPIIHRILTPRLTSQGIHPIGRRRKKSSTTQDVYNAECIYSDIALPRRSDRISIPLWTSPRKAVTTVSSGGSASPCRTIQWKVLEASPWRDVAKTLRKRTKKADGMGRAVANKPQSPEMAMSDGVNSDNELPSSVRTVEGSRDAYLSGGGVRPNASRSGLDQSRTRTTQYVKAALFFEIENRRKASEKDFECDFAWKAEDRIHNAIQLALNGYPDIFERLQTQLELHNRSVNFSEAGAQLQIG